MNNNTCYVFETNCKEIQSYSNKLTIETVTNLKVFKEFFRFPFQLYKDNSFWVPPFWKDLKDFFCEKNPFWSHSECILFIVKKNNKIAGRIAAIIDHKYCEIVGDKIGYFGFFECIEDFKCAEALFQSAQNWLKIKKMNIIRGPIDGRIDVGCGFLYKGFDSPSSFFSAYTPEYYISFAEKFNMKKIRDFITYYIDLSKPYPKQLEDKAQQCENSGVKIRNFNRLHTQKELNWWVKLFLETFVDHWGYVPTSAEEVRLRFGVKHIKWTVDPKLFLIAEYNGFPVAFLWSTPDYNQIFQKMKGKLGPIQLLKILYMTKKISKGKMHFIGIKKEFRNKDIGSCLNYKALVEMKRRGYIFAEVGVIDEKNSIAHSTIAITGAKPYKKYRVFEKNI
jgi:hypothetical protein